MTTIVEVIPPKFDLHGFYTAKINETFNPSVSQKQRVALLKALVNQAYQQGKYDARIKTK